MTEASELSPDFEESLQVYKQELIEPASLFFAVQQECSKNIREQTQKDYGRLLEAHLLITGVLSSALLRINGIVRPYREMNDQYNALFAAFLIGIESFENTIIEGRYLQAYSLLRQEMEILAQLKEARIGRLTDGKTPNIGLLDEDIRRMYGEITGAAHLSKHHIVKAATEYKISGHETPAYTSITRFFPEYDKELARRSFSLHLLIIIRLIEDYSARFFEQYSGLFLHNVKAKP